MATKSRAESPLVLRHFARAGAAGVTEVKIPYARRSGTLGRLRAACGETVNQPRKSRKRRALKQREPMSRNELERGACQDGTIARASMASS